MPDTRVSPDQHPLYTDPVFSWNGQGYCAQNDAARRLDTWFQQEGLDREAILSNPELPARRVEIAPGEGLLLLCEAPLQQRMLEQQASFGRLAAGFVHNLNNPLNALGGLIQLLQMKSGESRDLEKMERQLDNLTALVRCCGERYRKLHSRTDGRSLAWERIINQELEFYWADGVLKHQVDSRVEVPPEALAPLDFGDASWLFDRLLEAMIGCIEGRGSHTLTIRLEQGWPRLELAGEQAWDRDRALSRFVDGRLQEMLREHRRELRCTTGADSITLYTQELD